MALCAYETLPFGAVDALHSTLSKFYSVCLDQLLKLGVNPREIEGKTHTAKNPTNGPGGQPSPALFY